MAAVRHFGTDIYQFRHTIISEQKFTIPGQSAAESYGQKFIFHYGVGPRSLLKSFKVFVK